jgi:hypothetical protein
MRLDTYGEPRVARPTAGQAFVGSKKMNWPFGKRRYQLGDMKRLEDITLDDMREHPIWINDLGGEAQHGFDETSQRPVIGDANVTKRMLKESVSVSVHVTVAGTSFEGSADLSGDPSLSALAVWFDGEWKAPRDIAGFPSEAQIELVPALLGEEHVRFTYDTESDSGTR